MALHSDAVQILDDLTIMSGHISSCDGVNKFGRNTNVGTAAPEDIWNLGGIFVPPTEARIHQLASTSTNDHAAGTGLRTSRVYGLLSWDHVETSEIVDMNGTSDAPTANPYVIIHRIEAFTWGPAGPNVGDITATADIDGTVTAGIAIGKGQTSMAIYGIPRDRVGYMSNFYTSVQPGSGATANIVIELKYNPIPEQQLGGFIVKHSQYVNSDLATPPQQIFRPYKKFPGPGILKMQATTDKNNTDISGGFDLVIAGS